MPNARLAEATVRFTVRGRGPDVLLLPPAGTRAAIWDQFQVPALVAAGFRVITPDARGTEPGSAQRLAADIDDLVDDVVLLMDLLSLDRCLVAGASLGAMIAQELLIRHPSRVRAAALLGTRARTDYFRTRMARAQAQRLASADAGYSDLDVLTQMAQLFSARTLADDRAAADWFDLIKAFPLLGPGPASQYLATVLPDRRPQLATVTRPCLVVGFTEDMITPPACCREVASAIPAGRYLEIEGCGHFGFIERPDAVNHELESFFSEHT